MSDTTYIATINDGSQPDSYDLHVQLVWSEPPTVHIYDDTVFGTDFFLTLQEADDLNLALLAALACVERPELTDMMLEATQQTLDGDHENAYRGVLGVAELIHNDPLDNQ